MALALDCPACKKKYDDEQIALHEDASKAYGKVSKEEWLRMTKEADRPYEKRDY